MITVTLVKKTSTNPSFGRGSEYCFILHDGTKPREAPKIEFPRFDRKGRPAKFCFKIDTPGYPFVLEYEDPGNPSVGKVPHIHQLTEPIEKGRLIIQIDSTFPESFRYGSTREPDMGGPIIIENPNDIAYNPISLPRPLKNAVAIRPFQNGLLIGLATGHIYNFVNNELKLFYDLMEIAKVKSIQLLDFVILPDHRVTALVSGLKRKPNIFLIEVGSDRQACTQPIDLPETGPVSMLLDFPTLFFMCRGIAYRIDIENPGGYSAYEDNEDDAIYLKPPDRTTCIQLHDNKMLYLGAELYEFDKRVAKFFTPITVAEKISANHFLAGNAQKNLLLFSLKKSQMISHWTTEIPAGLISIASTSTRVYLLHNDTDGRVQLYTLENWDTPANQDGKE